MSNQLLSSLTFCKSPSLFLLSEGGGGGGGGGGGDGGGRGGDTLFCFEPYKMKIFFLKKIDMYKLYIYFTLKFIQSTKKI